MTLDEYLAANCRYLEEAVKDVPAKRDLPPFFTAMKDGMAIIFDLDFRVFDKALAVDLFEATLKITGADQYAIISGAWYVKLGKEFSRAEQDAITQRIDREGTDAFKDLRRECYAVTVGDRERSLIAMFDVERDYKGKIRRLTRQGAGGHEAMFGRIVDLLVERTRH